MSTLDTLLLFSAPIGALIIGAFVYWRSGRDARAHRRAAERHTRG